MNINISDDKIAVLYARVSTPDQAEKGVSLEAQLAECRKKAKALDAHVMKEFVDAGVSGRDDNRPALQEMMDYCRDVAPDYLIMLSTSRFFRNTLKASLYSNELEKLGVECVYTTVDLQGDDDNVFVLKQVLQMVDDLYSRNNAKATTTSMIQNAKNGYFNGSTVPFGYDSVPAEDDPNRKSLVPNAAEVIIVKMIFEMKANQAMGARSIALELNNQKITNRGKQWTKSKVGNLRKSRRVIGQNVFNQKNRKTGQKKPESEWIIIKSHPPIISESLFMNVQELISTQNTYTPNTKRRSPFIFSSLLKCGACGSPMTVEGSTGNGGVYHYYVCTAAKHENKHPARRLIAGEVDSWLLQSICDEVFTMNTMSQVLKDLKSDASAWEQDAKKQRRELTLEIQKIERKRIKIFELFEEFGKETPNLKDVTVRLREHTAAQDMLKAELKELDPSNAPKPSVTDSDLKSLRTLFRDIILSAEPVKIRSFVRSFIESINVESESVSINYNPSRLILKSKKRHGIDGFVYCPRWLPGADSKRTLQLFIPGHLFTKSIVSYKRDGSFTSSHLRTSKISSSVQS